MLKIKREESGINSLKEIVWPILTNKIYIVMIVLIAISTYGFEITHLSLGIDDFGAKHYLELSAQSLGNMLQQGRLMHIVIYYLTGLVDVIPFLNDFIAVILLGVSAILFVGVLQWITDCHFSIAQMILFSGLYISNSVISFKFIYDLDVVVTMLSYVCVITSIYFGLRFLETTAIREYCIAALFLICAIGSYESFIAVYIVEVIFFLIVYAIYKGEKNIKLIFNGMKLASILMVTIVVYYGAVKILQNVTNNVPYSRDNILTMGMRALDIVRVIKYRLMQGELFFAREFVIVAICSVIIAIYFTIKKRNVFIFVLFAAMGFFTLFIQIVQGYVYFRTCQTFNVFVACIILFGLDILDKKRFLNKINIIIVSLLIIAQIKDINMWFYKDWINYQKSVYAMHYIATTLQEDYSVEEKAVCFVNRNYNSYLMTWDEYQQEIGEAPVISAVGFLGDNTTIYKLFEYQGYDFFIEPTNEQMKTAKELSEDMEQYPNGGYIKETDELIVVNMGEYQ